MKQSSRKKRVLKVGKSVRDTSVPTVRSPPKATMPTNITYTRRPSTKPIRLCHCRFSLYEFPWALLSWFHDSLSPDILDPSGSHSSSSSTSQGFLELWEERPNGNHHPGLSIHLKFGCRSQPLEEDTLLINGQGTNLWV